MKANDQGNFNAVKKDQIWVLQFYFTKDWLYTAAVRTQAMSIYKKGRSTLKEIIYREPRKEPGKTGMVEVRGKAKCRAMLEGFDGPVYLTSDEGVPELLVVTDPSESKDGDIEWQLKKGIFQEIDRNLIEDKIAWTAGFILPEERIPTLKKEKEQPSLEIMSQYPYNVTGAERYRGDQNPFNVRWNTANPAEILAVQNLARKSS